MRHATALIAFAVSLLTASPAFAQLTPQENAAFERALQIMGDDPAGARKLVEPLADKGDGESLNFMATLIQHGGPDWDPDPKRANELREAAVTAGSKAAAMNIAIGLMMDSEADHDRAVELLKIADTEEQLKAITAYPWGRAYLFGWGVNRDMKRGVAYLEAFADGHNGVDDMKTDAHFLVGRAYRNGWDVAVDSERAFRHFRISADLGDPRAQWNTGMMLLNGEGAAQDDNAAFGYVRQSAENELLDGMISLAVMLALGQGVAEDDEAARDWYYQASKRGSAHALRGLGMMLVIGEGGAANPALGIALLQLAAEAGEQNAINLLSIAPDDAAAPDDIAMARASWVQDHGLPQPDR